MPSDPDWAVPPRLSACSRRIARGEACPRTYPCRLTHRDLFPVLSHPCSLTETSLRFCPLPAHSQGPLSGFIPSRLAHRDLSPVLSHAGSLTETPIWLRSPPAVISSCRLAHRDLSPFLSPAGSLTGTALRICPMPSWQETLPWENVSLNEKPSVNQRSQGCYPDSSP